VYVVLNILYEIAPRPYLRADIKELCKHRLNEVRVLEQLPEAPVIGSIRGQSFFGDFWELGPDNQNGPKKNNTPKNQVRSDHSHRFLMKIGIKCSSHLHNVSLTLRQFNTGENEGGSD